MYPTTQENNMHPKIFSNLASNQRLCASIITHYLAGKSQKEIAKALQLTARTKLSLKMPFSSAMFFVDLMIEQHYAKYDYDSWFIGEDDEESLRLADM